MSGIDKEALFARIDRLKSGQPQNLMARHFSRAYFNSLGTDQQSRFLACINSGLENPDSAMGCYARQAQDYEDFRPFFDAVLSDHHGTSPDAVHVSNWHCTGDLDLARLGLPPLSVRVRVGRNLAGYPLPGGLSADQRLDLENQLVAGFERLGLRGRYSSLTPGHRAQLSETGYRDLITRHLMFKPMDSDPYLTAAGIAADWPSGRGCFISADENFIVWIGEEDQLRIMVMERTTDLASMLAKLKEKLDRLEAALAKGFERSDRLGYITSCPTNLGTGMRASVHLRLPHLAAGGSDKKVKQLAAPLGLTVRGLGGEHTPVGSDGTVDISPAARFCITEAQIMERLHDGIAALLEAESRV